MPFIQPYVSPSLKEEITRAREMHRFIQTQIPDQLSDEHRLVGLLFSLVMEHHGAILLLLETGHFDGSAFALVRPLIDAAYRAHWICVCARPEIVERIRNGENVYPGLPQMADGIEAKLDAGGFFAAIKPFINTLHGYTHGGLEQLTRRLDAVGNISPNYSDEEKAAAISSTTAHVSALAIAWCLLVTGKEFSDEPRSAAISAHFRERFPLAS